MVRTPISEGLGDTVAKLTTYLGVKPCEGCARRQALLNKIFPYKDSNMPKLPPAVQKLPDQWRKP